MLTVHNRDGMKASLTDRMQTSRCWPSASPTPSRYSSILKFKLALAQRHSSRPDGLDHDVGCIGLESSATTHASLAFLFFALPWEHFLRDLIDAPLAWTADIALQFLDLIGYHLHYWNDHTIYTKSTMNRQRNLLGMNSRYAHNVHLDLWLVHAAHRQTSPAFTPTGVPSRHAGQRSEVATIYLLGHYGGNELADGFWHTGSAYVLFVPVFWFVYVVSNALLRRGVRGNATKAASQVPE